MNGSRRKVGLAMRLFEDLQAAVTVGSWPARLVDSMGLWPRVRPIVHPLEVSGPIGRAGSIRIVFAADWHAGPTTSDRTLEDAVVQIRAARPDVVLLGGDFVSLRAHHGRRLIPFLRRLEARHGVFAVLGNHDYYCGPEVVEDQLAEAGITLLHNRSVALGEPHEGVSIVGIDDHGSGSPDAAAALAGAGDVRVLLMHQPSGLLDLPPDAGSVDVAFAGHTHGGQMVLPGLPPLYLPKGALSRRYVAGRYATERGPLLVSRGIGCTLFPFRLNASADILVVDLRTKASDR
jgi:predicted MPP superfamily phosphohydrolase